jgi:hypothetical protein
MAEGRTCSKCKTYKDAEHFRVKNTGKLDCWCRACNKEYKQNKVYTKATKVCSKCKEEKPVDEFYRNNKDITNSCKVCQRADGMIKRALKNPKEVIPEGYKRCSICKELKLQTEFSSKNSRCRPCNTAYSVELQRNAEAYTLPTKTCTKCCLEKPVELFHKSYNGFSSWCASCTAAQYAEKADEINRKNRERYRNDDDYRATVLAWCKIYYDNNSDKCKARVKKYAEDNAGKIKEYRIGYYFNNSDLIKAKVKQYVKEHPEKARANYQNYRARRMNAEGEISGIDILSLHMSQDGKCYLCSNIMEEYHVEHKVPLSRGGTNLPDNIALSCPTCNQSKHTKTVEEYIEYRKLKDKVELHLLLLHWR